MVEKRVECDGLPDSQEKEYFDEQSTENPQLLFSHERAALKHQQEVMSL